MTNSLNEYNKLLNEFQQNLSKYNADVSKYQAEVNTAIQKWQNDELQTNGIDGQLNMQIFFLSIALI